MLKRLFDLLVSALALVFLFPIFLLISIWIKIDSPGEVFFRQERVGRYGKIFRIHKFRTMTVNAESKGLQLTVGSDRRVTGAGAFLRKTKLDELPQLLDVFVGDMSLVGPRPEVPRYMDQYPPAVREEVLSVRPGITDRASIEFRNENEMLAGSADPERTYVEEVLPIKQKYYLAYVRSHSLLGDLKIILDTVVAIATK
ncbi:sugar transferase [Pseudomonas sp. JM0905a]|uniref:sugar transferase n=1 Tax=Pseudomonas sp. JM0905a TaxID=2772484 RepID=UPI001685F58A|nr:sugar transferase [Pseudomonas sp. JM0905a]MBD2837681.1 sugar transferase [Pseudomonas sp. JM0905a]